MSLSEVAAADRDRGVRLEREGFERLAEPLVPALRLHCYRLVGSLDDAEDMVQEAFVRAWRHRDRLAEPRGFRPWLYRIATNVCLDHLDRRRRRPTTTLDDELRWPDPIPDAWMERDGGGGDPAEMLIRRETVSLAFLTAVQLLPPRQRAMLVLRDVLEWPAQDVAEALETTVAAVYSGVRRARAAIRERSPGRSPGSPSTHDQAHTREVAHRYLDAWERADTAGLAELLAADARMAMPPDPRSFEGRTAILGHFEAIILGRPPDERIRLHPTTASGEPAFLVLEPEPGSGKLRRIGLKVIVVRDGRIVEIRGYMRADLAARFDPPRSFEQSFGSELDGSLHP